MFCLLWCWWRVCALGQRCVVSIIAHKTHLLRRRSFCFKSIFVCPDGAPAMNQLLFGRFVLRALKIAATAAAAVLAPTPNWINFIWCGRSVNKWTSSELKRSIHLLFLAPHTLLLWLSRLAGCMALWWRNGIQDFISQRGIKCPLRSSNVKTRHNLLIEWLSKLLSHCFCKDYEK